MRPDRRVAVLGILAVLGLGAAGCRTKRPPAVKTDAGRSTSMPAPTSSPTAEPERWPVDAGPDVQPLPDEGARAEDFSLSDPSGEGGPLTDIRFDYDQARLSDEARGILERHALWLQNHRAAKIVVEGHCDERGTTDYNLALGEQRARASRDYLASLGVAADRMIIVSFGKEKPLDPGSNESAWSKNRRAHFVVSR